MKININKMVVDLPGSDQSWVKPSIESDRRAALSLKETLLSLERILAPCRSESHACVTGNAFTVRETAFARLITF